MSYDLFISYCRRDNTDGHVTELVEHIAADYRQFSGEEFPCFFDKHDIHGMEDWRHTILDGLKQSHLFLLVLSPEYLTSP
jgi:TIR domain